MATKGAAAQDARLVQFFGREDIGFDFRSVLACVLFWVVAAAADAHDARPRWCLGGKSSG